MAVAAGELHVWASGTAADELQVNRVVHLDRSGTSRGMAIRRLNDRKFGMVRTEAMDMRLVKRGACSRYSVRGFQVPMTTGANLIAHCRNINAAAMFRVTRSAVGSRRPSEPVVSGPVVASQAGAVDGLRRKFTGFLKMASGTLFSRTAWAPLMRPLE